MKIFIAYNKTDKTYLRRSYYHNDAIKLEWAATWSKHQDASRAIWRKVGRKPSKHSLLLLDPDALAKQKAYDNYAIIEIDITPMVEQEIAKL